MGLVMRELIGPAFRVLILGVYFERAALVGLEIAFPEPMRGCCRGS
jgi:hypothetical protein